MSPRSFSPVTGDDVVVVSDTGGLSIPGVESAFAASS